MQFVNTPNAPAPVGPYSQGIATDNLVFFSGQVALDANGKFHGESLEVETKQIFKNIEALLSAARLKKENIVKSMIFLTDISNFSKVNKLYANFFGDHKPARSCIGVAELPLGATVEIEILATK